MRLFRQRNVCEILADAGYLASKFLFGVVRGWVGRRQRLRRCDHFFGCRPQRVLHLPCGRMDGGEINERILPVRAGKMPFHIQHCRLLVSLAVGSACIGVRFDRTRNMYKQIAFHRPTQLVQLVPVKRVSIERGLDLPILAVTGGHGDDNCRILGTVDAAPSNMMLRCVLRYRARDREHLNPHQNSIEGSEVGVAITQRKVIPSVFQLLDIFRQGCAA